MSGRVARRMRNRRGEFRLLCFDLELLTSRGLVLAIGVVLAVQRRGRHAGGGLGLGDLCLITVLFFLLQCARDGLDQLVLAHGTVSGDAERARSLSEVFAGGGLESVEVHGTAA